MFGWIKTRRDGGNEPSKSPNSRRAFRPEGDRLESREVLSLFSLAGSATPQFIAGMTSTPMSTSLSHVTTASFSNFANAASNFANAASNLNAAGTTLGSVRQALSNAAVAAPAAVANLLKTSPLATNGHFTTTTHTRTLPREAGQSNSVNTGLFNSGRAGAQVFPASSFPTSLVSGATSGLAFSNISSATNGLAFSNINSVTNGLTFTNNTGFSNPSQSFNGATNGLAFTNNAGFSTPGTSFNGATNGLAFLGGLGF